MKKIISTILVATTLISLLILFSCKENNEDIEFTPITVNVLIVNPITFNSVEVSGIIADNTNANVISGGYYLGKHENADSVIYKESLIKNFSDTLSLNSNQEYWVQPFIKTKTDGIIKGEKIRFRTSKYKIIFEKYVTIHHEYENSYSDKNYDFVDCILDSDENIVLVGSVASRPYMVKIDKNGNYLWHNTFSNFPEQWAGYHRVYISNTDDYVAIYVTWQSLYITKISKDGNFTAYYKIETNNGIEITPGFLYDIHYDDNKDLFTWYSAITEYFSDEHIDFSFKIIKFDSNGRVFDNKKINTPYNINHFDGDWYLINNSRYCIGHLPNFYDGSIITKVDENMNILYKKELFGYNIQRLAMRENNILVVATTYDGIGVTRKFKFFEIDKSLTEFKELSEQWNVSEPFIYDYLTDKEGNTIISGGNGIWFNEYGSMCIISSNNRFLYKEQDFGINDRVLGIGKWMITRFEFIKKLSDNSILLIGEYNPDFYDGPIDKVYLRKFSY
jgi:hypothetical protein